MPCPITQAVAAQVRSNRVQPSGEFPSGIEARAVLINAYETFLRDILGVLLVPELAHQIMKKFFGVALYQGVEGGVAALAKACHVRPVEIVRGGHGARWALCIP